MSTINQAIGYQANTFSTRVLVNDKITTKKSRRMAGLLSFQSIRQILTTFRISAVFAFQAPFFVNESVLISAARTFSVLALGSVRYILFQCSFYTCFPC